MLALCWAQVGPKIDQNFDQNFDRCWDRFLIDLGGILGRFLEGFGPQVEGQVGQKIDHVASCWQVGQNTKNTKKPKVFQWFWAPRPANLEAKMAPKSI